MIFKRKGNDSYKFYIVKTDKDRELEAITQQQNNQTNINTHQENITHLTNSFFQLSLMCKELKNTFNTTNEDFPFEKIKTLLFEIENIKKIQNDCDLPFELLEYISNSNDIKQYFINIENTLQQLYSENLCKKENFKTFKKIYKKYFKDLK
ncbi:hypothetical protein CWI38_1109p0010 [Hamiltosporidium tvaerminnensis]|uniref:Uncharacterized protein n=1 Tax=Hamiltosporidium tvaerminnensis TaxID=1176355 RepID=A0A4Q9LSQ6_9MICR|nr:hypothetical protein CWI38_1112p0020 [Hamiltosporidium tvaerminnensis]TBU11629.1 hypothetical protein CWI38_1109p0010 [Hamiltosporidium tvaerminnensis]